MSEPGTSDPWDQQPAEGDDLPGPEAVADQPSVDDHFRPPQLGIIHLLAWMTVTAVLLKFYLASSANFFSELTFEKVMHSVDAAVAAAGIVGFAILVRAWRYGSMGRLQPGHRMALIQTLFTLFWYVSSGTLFLLTQMEVLSRRQESNFCEIVACVLYLVSSALWFWALRCTVDGHRWNVLFGLYCASDTILVFGYLSDSHNMLIVCVLLVATITTVLLDCARGPRRDWLHWLGVAIRLCRLLGWGAWLVWFLYFCPIRATSP
jgi:hypothetical protein